MELLSKAKKETCVSYRLKRKYNMQQKKNENPNYSIKVYYLGAGTSPAIKLFGHCFCLSITN